MRYSPIAPIALLQEMYKEGLLGDYHLVLAHDVLEHETEYEALFEELRDAHKSFFVILDNSLIELGHALPQKELQRAARIVVADCIVMPDVLGKALETLDSARKFYNAYERSGHVHNVPFMAVPQGATIEEHVMCARLLRQIPNVQYWGVPRNIANKFKSRAHTLLMKELGYGEHYNGVDNVHMLGMSVDYYDDIKCAHLPGVMGIDSANPCVLGQNGMHIKNTHAPPHLDRGDYWTHTELKEETITNITTVRNDIHGV